MPLIEKKHRDLIFIDMNVIIILNGRVVLRKHERNPLKHSMLASYQSGQILGFEDGDDGITKDCDVWVSVASKQIQYIEMTRETFKVLWKYS